MPAVPQAVRNVVFSNTGKVNYDFVWTVESTGTLSGPGAKGARLSSAAPVVVSPQSGKVRGCLRVSAGVFGRLRVSADVWLVSVDVWLVCA